MVAFDVSGAGVTVPKGEVEATGFTCKAIIGCLRLCFHRRGRTPSIETSGMTHHASWRVEASMPAGIARSGGPLSVR
jgi:hypothetical protein